MLAALGMLPLAGSVMGAAPPRQSLPVSQVCNGRAFSYTVEERSTSRLYRVYRFSYPSPVVTAVAENNTIPGDYYLPKGIRPDGPRRPAVICLHILNGNFEMEQITCATLASRGIPAIMIKLPYYGERSPPGGAHALLSNPRLPFVPDDTVLVSGGDRAQTLSRRLQQSYGRIDVPARIDIIKRPVAMQSNLHDAIFAPETLEMWFADAGRHTVACDEPYSHCKLDELIRWYQANIFGEKP
jgi:hypothetical protein